MDLRRIRGASVQAAKKLGVDVPVTLPLLDARPEMRSAKEVVSRLLAMNAVAASAYGFDKAKAASWLNREALTESLSEREKHFMFGGGEQADQFKVQIEGMWALAWSMAVVNELNFAKDCDSRFATILPNLKQSQTSADFREKVCPRPVEKVVTACDLAYCLHWGIRQAELTEGRAPGNLKTYVVVERRRALDWLLSQEAWDEVQLDT